MKDVNYTLPGGNFLNKASADKLLSSPTLGKKKVLKKKAENGMLPGSLTGSLNGQQPASLQQQLLKKKRKSDDGENGAISFSFFHLFFQLFCNVQ